MKVRIRSGASGSGVIIEAKLQVCIIRVCIRQARVKSTKVQLSTYLGIAFRSRAAAHISRYERSAKIKNSSSELFEQKLLKPHGHELRITEHVATEPGNSQTPPNNKQQIPCRGLSPWSPKWLKPVRDATETGAEPDVLNLRPGIPPDSLAAF